MPRRRSALPPVFFVCLPHFHATAVSSLLRICGMLPVRVSPPTPLTRTAAVCKDGWEAFSAGRLAGFPELRRQPGQSGLQVACPISRASLWPGLAPSHSVQAGLTGRRPRRPGASGCCWPFSDSGAESVKCHSGTFTGTVTVPFRASAGRHSWPVTMTAGYGAQPRRRPATGIPAAGGQPPAQTVIIIHASASAAGSGGPVSHSN